MTTHGSASSAEKPASAEKSARSPERVPDMTLSTLCDIFAERSEETLVKQFLRDVATLRAWQSQVHPTHKIRDEMTKLGSKWNVPQKAARKKRAPQDLASDLEQEFLAYAQRLWKKSNPFSKKRSAGKPSSDALPRKGMRAGKDMA